MTSLRPPQSALYPIIALDTFLQQQQQLGDEESNDTAILERKMLTLRVADSLFGASLLEGALTTLESDSITEIQAVTSRRRMFVLTKKQQRRRRSEQEEPSKYFCLLPVPVVSPKNDSVTNKSKGFLFCSCRAYFEKTKSTTMNSPQASTSYMVCKHLLALKLRPALLSSSGEGCRYQKTETATEEQFSEQVLKLLLGGDGECIGIQ
ncbi:expressed unknown protein [Seminavis robusta]|uniref:SWIM-type domain-containing protein n=1 Tax=Seminavis robusta TaxID=568900 RepID=A0A9N8ENK8_9STRA|nr:expressed unknown protein [Seminavis robusta]|eukprot:Sro1437_g272500.1 n/a (207) ;mRNA; r:5065-5685